MGFVLSILSDLANVLAWVVFLGVALFVLIAPFTFPPDDLMK